MHAVPRGRSGGQVIAPGSMIGCTHKHIIYICDRMREDEIAQYIVLSGHTKYDPEQAALEFMSLSGPKLTIVGPDGYPAASGGYHEVFPGVWQSWMCGTQQGWETSWRSLTKGTRWLMDSLFDRGARRLQTTALASRTKAIKWYIDGLKMEPCGTMKAFGINGEDVAMFQRIHPNLGES